MSEPIRNTWSGFVVPSLFAAVDETAEGTGILIYVGDHSSTVEGSEKGLRWDAVCGMCSRPPLLAFQRLELAHVQPASVVAGQRPQMSKIGVRNNAVLKL